MRNIYSTNESGDNAIADNDHTFEMLDDVSFEVLDPKTLVPVEPNAVGALHIRCPWLFKGYWTAEGVGYHAGPDERFRTGDLVRTLHHGPQSIRWIGKKAIKLAPNFSQDKLRPIQISISALGQGLPHKPLRLSRQHRLLVS